MTYYPTIEAFRELAKGPGNLIPVYREVVADLETPVSAYLKIAREPAVLLMSLALLAGLAPVVEELIFRGLLFGWIEGRWGPGTAFIVSSLAFAAAHVEPAHAILVLPLGLLFGWLRWRTGSLWPSLVAHIANNGLAVLAVAFFDP